jgi:hypothetical protein
MTEMSFVEVWYLMSLSATPCVLFEQYQWSNQMNKHERSKQANERLTGCGAAVYQQEKQHVKQCHRKKKQEASGFKNSHSSHGA